MPINQEQLLDLLGKPSRDNVFYRCAAVCSFFSHSRSDDGSFCHDRFELRVLISAGVMLMNSMLMSSASEAALLVLSSSELGATSSSLIWTLPMSASDPRFDRKQLSYTGLWSSGSILSVSLPFLRVILVRFCCGSDSSNEFLRAPWTC